MKTKLPKKLSDLLELALSDLRKCEKDPRYVINMFQWHTPLSEGKCEVCLAGAVLAKTCKLLPTDSVVDEGEGCRVSMSAHYLANYFEAIDALREGYRSDALYYLLRASDYEPVPLWEHKLSPKGREAPNYTKANRAAFHRWGQKEVKALRKAGL